MADEPKKKSLDERLDALTMNLELLSHQVEAHDRQLDTIVGILEKTGHQIQALTALAETQNQRITRLEGGE